MTSRDLDSTPVTRDLDSKGIPYKFFRHSEPIQSLEQAARERGQRPEQIVRSILFRLSKDEFVIVLIAGPRQISWPSLRKYLGKSRVSMAKAEEVLAVTGYSLGAVSPFGLPQPIRILVDKSVSTQEEISIGSGVRYTTVIMRRNDLLRALGKVEWVDFCKEIKE